MTNTPKAPRLIPTPELLGSMMSDSKDSVLAEFCSAPESFFKRKYGCAVFQSVKVAYNTADIVHLTLPYYIHVKQAGKVSLSDEDLEVVTGGWSGRIWYYPGEYIRLT